MLIEMNLDKKIENDIKSAMLAKDKLRLEVCRLQRKLGSVRAKND